MDDRTLHRAMQAGGSPSGNAGTTPVGAEAGQGASDGGVSPAPQGGSSAGSSPIPAGGEGGTPAPGPLTPTVLDGCVDLDANGVRDCDENKAPNGTFADDATGWQAEDTAKLEWKDVTSFGDPLSGSALVTSTTKVDTDGNGVTSAFACLPVNGGDKVSLFANVLVPAGQDAGLGAVQLWFFDAPDCGGVFLTSASSDYSASIDSWATLRVQSTAGETALSVKIRLAVLKAFRSESFAVHFDNILVHTP